MIVDPVNDKVGEPGCLSGSLEQFEEELKGLLAEVVTEDLEGHQGGAVVEKGLCQESQTVVLDFVVGQVNMHKLFILRNRLGEGLGTIVTDFVIGNMKCLKRAIRALQVLSDSFASFE